MPESLLTQVRTVLLLDNSQSDATQLCETLNTLPLWQLSTTIHLSGEGIFPTAERSFDLLLVADDYAHSKLGQIIEIAKFYQPHARIVLLSTAQGGEHSPQEFVDAARAGVSYCLLRENLSVDALLEMLQQVFNNSEQATKPDTTRSAALSLADSKDLHWILDLRKGTIGYDAAAQQALGINSDMAPSTVQQWQATIHPDDIDQLMGGVNACMAGQAEHGVQPYRIRNDNGRWLPVQAPALLAERDDKGITVRIVGRFRLPDESNNESSGADTVVTALDEMRSAKTDDIADEITLGIIKFSAAGEDFVYRSINHAAAKSEQLNPPELIGQRLMNHAPSFENFNLGNALRQVSADSATQTHRVMSLRDDATASWREIVIQRLPDGDLLVEIQNVTERVQNDTNQRYEEQIWRHIVNSLPDMSVLLDENGTIMRVISGEWQQLNIDTAQLVGEPITNILLPGEREKCQQNIQKALNTGKTQIAIYAIDSMENQLRLQVKIALLHTEVSAPRQVIWVAREIAESHIEADRLVNDHELINEMLQRAPFLTAITDVEGRYEHVNPAFAQQIQQPSDAIIGKTDADLFGEQVGLTLQNLDQKLLAEGVAQQSDIVLPGEGGEQRFRVIKIPLNGMSMLTQNIFTFAMPLTKLEQTEHEQLPATQPESIDDLVSDIARDFNDVLVNLTEHTRMALYDADGEPASEITTYLRAVMNSSQRARDLVLQMMAYQNNDESKIQTSAVDLTLFMSGIVELLRNTIGQHLQITSDLQQHLLVKEIDSLRIQNSLIQLFRVAQESFDASGHLSLCMHVLTGQDHVCAYCYGKVRGDFVEISMYNSMQTNTDALNNVVADLPQDETLLSQIKRIHELLKPYGGHIMRRGTAGEEESWHVFLAVDPEAECALKICPPSEAEQAADGSK
ncbi:MAG: PAS domain-containing protein [Pseudomonadales bacterium]